MDLWHCSFGSEDPAPQQGKVKRDQLAMSKRVILPLVFLVLAFFTEVIFQGFRKKIRPPPLWVNEYAPSNFPSNWNDRSSPSASYYDELPLSQSFNLSSTDLAFFDLNHSLCVEERKNDVFGGRQSS